MAMIPKVTKYFKDKSCSLWQLVTSPGFWAIALPIVLIVPNIGLVITESDSLGSKITNILLPLGVYYVLTSLSIRIGRTILLMLLFMILGAFQVVLLYLYGESIIAVDMFLNLVTTNVSEATELLSNLKMAIFTVCIIYLPCILAGIYLIVKRRYAPVHVLIRCRRVGISLVVVGVLSLMVTWLADNGYRPRRQVFPYNVCENMVTAVRRTHESLKYYTTSNTFSYRPTSTRSKDLREVYVLVLGETSRADNWQIMGYGRPTNPRLSHRADIYAFDHVLSEINTTHKSVPMLLSYLTPETFGGSVAHTRSVLAAFNDLGYHTAFLSNQRRNHSYIEYYGAEARTVHYISDDGGPQLDGNLLAPMQRIIETSPSNKVFIVLHTYGSHFEYNKRYPREEAVFLDDRASGASAQNRPDLVNAYDNTIVYTDKLLDEVVLALDSLDVPAVMVYTSDHGEDIFDDARGRFLHASPTPTYYQLHVPMLLWTSGEYAALFPEKIKAMRCNAHCYVSSTRSLFHTILDMAGIDSPQYDPSLSVMSGVYRSPQARYLNDYNESIMMNCSGLRSPDFVQMRRHGFPVFPAD